MSTETSPLRLLSLLLLTAAGLFLATLAACMTGYRFDVTPTPTRTPRPTATFTPSPTPTPVWPVTVGCDTGVPQAACARLREAVDRDPAHLAWTENPAPAELRLTTESVADGQPLGFWTYAAAAPFFTLEDDIASDDLRTVWTEGAAGSFAERPLLVTTDTLRVLTSLWGPPSARQVQTVPAPDLLAEAIQLDGWAIVPFHDLEPRWKVLRLDSLSPLERALDQEAYPLSLPLYFVSERRFDAFALLPSNFANRDEAQMTIVVMTGVTALTRGTAQAMEERGTTYPAQDIGNWLRDADLTHISNEVSFTPDCPVPPPQGTMVFCSHERYIELLDAVGTDIVELTGNHNNDYGIEPDLYTLELFRERGWRWFGGGTDLAEASRPLTLTLGPNRLAFLGCNAVGPSYAWATDDSPGAAPCDFERMQTQVADLRADGWLPIVTVQAYETYEYFPTPEQRASFRALAQAGAEVVQGSQAHQPQAFDFHSGAFIHYGLGNLFFDQMQSVATRQEFADRLVFYDGRLLAVDLYTAMLEDYARPRPMTTEERWALLDAVFAESSWGADEEPTP
jgi:hypothetical protein